jgi:hypothetical protein
MSAATAYVLAEWLLNEAMCTCGWTGRRRIFRGHAVVDALLHCADTGHTPAGATPDSVPVIKRDRVSSQVGPDIDGTSPAAEPHLQRRDGITPPGSSAGD